MIRTVGRLWVAATLIIVASAALLLTDRERPRAAAGGPNAAGDVPGQIRSIALFQNSSQALMEEAAKGVLAGLAAEGFTEGPSFRIRRYNAEGDTATLNSITQAIIGGGDDLVITLSTSCLQAVAAANRDAHRPHVFGMVSDPAASGVGIARDDPRKHPPYMVGLGTMQPVAETFRMARRLAPGLKRVGVAWNPSEANSEACTKVARIICKELGLDLLEATVDGSASVRDAAASLVARGVEAIWVGGDATVLVSLDAVIAPARASAVPVFTSISGCAARGSVFDLGSDYYQVGEQIAALAVRVLQGTSPADMPIQYEMPPELWINRVALDPRTRGWSIPEEIVAKADVVVDKGGPVRRHPHAKLAAATKPASGPARTWKLGLAGYSESAIMEDLLGGFHQGIKESGLVDGKDYVTIYRSAQGDIATLSAILDEFNGDDTDLVFSISTPVLQAALRKVDRKPVVFAGVLDPIAAGAGKSDSDHHRGITGRYLGYPYAEMARVVRTVLPSARKVGTLFSPGEINSAVARERFQVPLRAEGLELVSLPVNGPTEVSDAALSLCQSGIDVVCQISDNLSNASFPAISRACETAGMPLFTFSPAHVKRGAVLGVGCDFAENGREAGLLVAEVIRGKDPSRTPFRATTKVTRSVNLVVARRLGITIPRDWLKTASQVIDAAVPTRQNTP
jgi:ABC-type uncharacterized transport system substrate-binding protein